MAIDGVSIAPLLLGEQEDSDREWIMALGHGPARLDEKGVRGVHDFAARVMRDKEYKTWVSTDKEIIRLHNLAADPWEEINLVESDAPEHRTALKKF